MARRIMLTFAVFVATVLVLSGVANATYATKTFTSYVLTRGTTLAGNLASLTTVDGNVLRINSTGGGSSALIYEFSPNSDNVSDDYGWARNCPSYWQCVVDGGTGYTDGNTTIMWTTATGPHASIGFINAGYLLLGRTIIDVTLRVWVRSNNTGILGLSIELVDPVTNTTCLSVGTQGLITWSLQSGLAYTCSGNAWTPDIIDRIEARFLAFTNLGEVVSTAWIEIRTTTTPFYLLAYLNGTVSSTQTPLALNWTCNRTASLSYVNVDVWAQSSVSWVRLSGNACPDGAMAWTNSTLPWGFTWLAGSRFSVRVVSDVTLSTGYVSFDRFVYGVNDTFVAPPPGPPGVFGPGLEWLVVFVLACGAAIFVAWRVKKWRESE